MSQTLEEKKSQTIGEWVDSIESSMDEELIFKALEKAVDYGWVPKRVDTSTYMKNIERMKTILQAHTTQRLSELKERVEDQLEVSQRCESDGITSEEIAFFDGQKQAYKQVLQLIKEVENG